MIHNNNMIEPLEQYANIQPLVQKEIDDKLVAYNSSAQFNVVDIPAHTHNGVDSNRISADDLDGSTSSNIYLGALASNTLKESLDTERVINGNASGYPKSIRVNRSGSLRVKVDAHATTGYLGQTGAIYKNGVSILTLSSITNAYQTYTVDTTVNFGDLIQIYITLYGSGVPNYYVKNFRLYYDDVVLTSVPDVTIADTNL